jgi:uncharacterized membrane protein
VTDPAPAPAWDAVLRRAVDDGVVTAEQAAELARRARGTAPAGRTGVLPEVLGYLGGALAVVAALLLGARVWDGLGPVVRTLLLAAVTAACLAGGALLRTRGGAAGRLGGFLWAAGVPAAAATTAVVADAAGAGPAPTALAAAAVAAVLAAALWGRHRGALQQVATFVALAVLLLALLERLGTPGADGWWGVLVGLLGVGWLAGSTRTGASDGTGRVLGALAVIAGPLAADPGGHAGRVAVVLVAVLAAAAVVVLGVRRHHRAVTAVGTVGVFVTTPFAVDALFGDRLGALVGILVAGLALVVAAVVLVRRTGRRTG